MDFASLIWQLPILLMSLTIHEFSHGMVAYWLGDDTAKRAGRLTLNPISHIDPIGAIMLLVFHFGWAKPVPLNPYNFKNYKRDIALSAAAGPASNFLIAIVLSIVFRITFALASNNIIPVSQFGIYMFNVLQFAILINLALGLFNLIPIPPMDGSKILGGFLTDEQYMKFTAQERKGMVILLVLFGIGYVTGTSIIGNLIAGPLSFFMRLLIG